MIESGAANPARYLVVAASLVVLLAGMKAAEELLVPLVFAAFLTILSGPTVLWLQRRAVPDALGVPLVAAGVICVLGLVGLVVGGSVNSFVAAVPRYQARLDELQDTILGSLAAFGVSNDTFRQIIDPGQLLKLAGQMLSQTAAALSNAALIVLTMVFMLFEVGSMGNKLRAALGQPDADLHQFSKVTHEVNQYVAIKTYVSAATGVLIGVFLAILGIDFPILWALVVFILNYVPNIGSIIAAIPPVLLGLIQYGFGRALIALAGFVLVNMVVGNVVEPRLMGRKLGLSTLVVFISLVFWGWLWGPVGMLLSVPLTMIVKILLEHSGRQFRVIAVMMDAPTPSQRQPRP